MARISIGTVTPVPKGDYSATTTYNRLNWVKYNGALYCCKANGVVGVSPENTEFWMKQLDAPTDADGVNYDNSTSGLEADSVQGAIDEVVEDLGETTTALNSNLELAKAELQVLGWNVPEGMPVKNTLDNGVLTQNVGRVDLGSLNWAYSSTYQFWESIFSTGIPHSTTVKNNIYCATGVRSRFVELNTNRSLIGYTVNDSNYSGSERVLFRNGSNTLIPNGYLYYELATPITHTVSDTEGVAAFAKRNVTTNLLKPTLASTTVNGVTCTNNGDGTYTLNGTASANTQIPLSGYKKIVEIGKTYKIVGCPKNQGNIFRLAMDSALKNYVFDNGNGATYTFKNEDDLGIRLKIGINQDATFNNIIFKPMLTTDLTAIYDDFIPYTGDTGTLNGDVAEIQALMPKYYETDITINVSSATNNVELGTLNQLFGLSDATPIKSLFVYEKYSASRFVLVFAGNTSKIYAYSVNGNVPIGQLHFKLVVAV